MGETECLLVKVEVVKCTEKKIESTTLPVLFSILSKEEQISL